MFKEIFTFEIKYRLTRSATWAYFAILLVFGLIVSVGGNGPSSEKAFVNSPAAIAIILSLVSIYGIMLSSAIMGVPVYRDIEHKTENYYFSYPITEKAYLLGRFLGSMSVLFLISLGLHIGLILGFAIGPYVGYVEADRFTDLNLWYYIQPTFLLYWTNFFFAGCIFFTIVTLSKKVMLAYAGGAVLFIIYLLTYTLTQDVENKDIASILDPFGFRTLEIITQYWTPEEQNSLTIPFDKRLLWNRIIWVGLGFALLFTTLIKFNFQSFLNKNYSSKKKKSISDSKKLSEKKTLPRVTRSYSPGLNFKLLFNLAYLEFKNITRDFFFIAIFIAAVLFLFFDGWYGSPIYGTPSLPLTYYMLEVKNFTYVILIFILIVFISGEVLHRERSVKYDQIFGALPIPNRIIFGSKFLALVMICFVLVNMILISGVLNQILKGYYNFEFGMYFTDLYLFEFPKYIIFTMLAFFVHSLVTKKFLGHVIAIAIWVLLFGLNSLAEVDNNLYLYSYSPDYLISDMNGFGHFGESIFWFRTYWLACGAVLTLIAYLFWKRGTDTGRKARWKVMRERINLKTAVGLVTFIVIFIGTGFFINYNTSTLNNYRTQEEGIALQAEYEKTLVKYAKIAQPKVIDVKLEANLYPEKRSANLKAKYLIVNKSEEPIDSLHLNFAPKDLLKREFKELSINGKELNLEKDYKNLSYQIYALNETLKPKDTALLYFNIDGHYDGFPNEGFGENIVSNGTFMNNLFIPSFGYSMDMELTSDQDRKKYNLPVKDYIIPNQTDKWGISNLLFNDDADFISFEGVVSTSADQIAVLPGYLQKEWEEGGRKYYSYKMDQVMDLFYNISSAKYNVYREGWKDQANNKVNIEIFHHPSHTYNLDRFVNSAKKSFDYFTKNFGPYQHRQIRILEFPRYQTFAQSFPNTVPFSESFGWVGDFSDPNDLDYVFFVTSHEIAHQWWGHQISPSATRGSNQISESMAEYAALMVMKKEYGSDAMQRFLIDELDRYLMGRANESKFEKTLIDNDNQTYVWYRKGGLILYALQDLIGENNLNKGFKQFAENARFRPEAPFPTSTEWYSYIKKVTPDSLQYFIEDSFEKITLYSNRTTKASYKKLANDKYEVSLDLESSKSYYDGNGKLLETGSKPNLIEIGIFKNDTINEKGKTVKAPIMLEKVWVTPGKSSYTFITNQLPKKAGIDPYNKMIDRIPDDNLIVLDLVE